MLFRSSNYLSGIGITQMLDLLKERAGRFNRRIFIADHRAFDYGGFDGVIKIVKNSDGSKIL